MQQPSPPAEEPIGLLAAAVRSGVRRLIASRIDPLGLSAPQFWVLIGIAEHPCHSQAELAGRLRMDEATACRVVRALSEGNWVRSERDAGDRRRVQLALTRGGERLVRTLLPVARQVRAAVDGALTPRERAATRAALVKIVVALQRLARAPAAPGEGRAGPRRRSVERASTPARPGTRLQVPSRQDGGLP